MRCSIMTFKTISTHRHYDHHLRKPYNNGFELPIHELRDHELRVHEIRDHELREHKLWDHGSTGAREHRSTGAREHESTGAQEHGSMRALMKTDEQLNTHELTSS